MNAHLNSQDDGLVLVKPVPDRNECFADLIAPTLDESGFAELRAAGAIGRTLDAADFVAELEQWLGQLIAGCGPGRKPL